jgi:hypothetical protein
VNSECFGDALRHFRMSNSQKLHSANNCRSFADGRYHLMNREHLFALLHWRHSSQS